VVRLEEALDGERAAHAHARKVANERSAALDELKLESSRALASLQKQISERGEEIARHKVKGGVLFIPNSCKKNNARTASAQDLNVCYCVHAYLIMYQL
jgi:septal ring factor EnvC (AmiA/AmiB activator)